MKNQHGGPKSQEIGLMRHGFVIFGVASAYFTNSFLNFFDFCGITNRNRGIETTGE